MSLLTVSWTCVLLQPLQTGLPLHGVLLPRVPAKNHSVSPSGFHTYTPMQNTKQDRCLLQSAIISGQRDLVHLDSKRGSTATPLLCVGVCCDLHITSLSNANVDAPTMITCSTRCCTSSRSPHSTIGFLLLSTKIHMNTVAKAPRSLAFA